MADYQLLITRTSERDPTVVQITYSDSEWNRIVPSVKRLSQDGKRIFGVLSEGGATPVQQLFDYDAVHGKCAPPICESSWLASLATNAGRQSL